MAGLLVDSGALFGYFVRNDSHHAQAKAALSARSRDLVTTDYIVVETWVLLRARAGRWLAMKFWDFVAGGAVRVVGVPTEDLARARQIAKEWPDRDFSLVDCTSFAVMERLAMEEVASFDRHFRVYRYGPKRSKAFRVIP